MTTVSIILAIVSLIQLTLSIISIYRVNKQFKEYNKLKEENDKLIEKHWAIGYSKYIDKSIKIDGYYIDDEGVKTIIPSDTKELDLEDMNLVEIVCNSELEILFCWDNKLTKLILNNKLKHLLCENNLLTELTLNNNLEYLYCDIKTKLYNINQKTNINKMKNNCKIEKGYITHCQCSMCKGIEGNNEYNKI